MSLVLQEGEEVLATDQVLHYSTSFLANNAECSLTNKRLILIPKSTLSKISGSNLELPLDTIRNVTPQNGMVIIEHHGGSLQIGGTGADRMCERIQGLLNNDPNIISEKVIFQGDTNVYLKGPLSTKGEIILSNKLLTIRTTTGWELYLFEKRELKTPLIDIINLDFSNLEQKLTIESTHGKIAIGGKNAARLNSTLRSLEGADVEELANVTIDTFNVYEAMLHRGASKSAVSGVLSFSPNRLTFAPQNVLDTLTGAQLQILPFDEIQKISKKNRLEVTTLSSKLSFITNKAEEIYDILINELIKVEREPLFTDIRSKLYSETLAFNEVKELQLPVNVYSEIPILCDQCIIFKGDESCYFGYAFITEEKTRLLTPNKQVLWESDNNDITIVENRSSTDPKIQLKVNEQRINFKPRSGVRFRDFYKRKLKESRPSEAEQFSKENQPVQRILGLTKQVELKYNGEVINVIHNTRVSAENRGIQINSEKLREFECQIGDKVQVEIPKKEGRYRFQSVITEQYLVEPDPIGRYYITFAIPSNIALFNDRGAYRAPFEQALNIEILELPPYDSFRENPLDFLPDSKELRSTDIKLRDLSVSGCGFLIRRSIFAFDLPLECLVFKGTIAIDGENIPWMAIPKYEVPFRFNKVEFHRVGAQFIGMSNIDRSIINRAVLRIERDQLRKENDRREDREQ